LISVQLFNYESEKEPRAIRVNLARMRPNSNKRKGKEEKMGDLIRECGETINYFGRFPVDVVQASKLRLLPSREGRIAGDGLELQTMPSPAKRAGCPILCVLLQILTDIIRHITKDEQHLSNHAQAVESPFLEFNQRMPDIPRTSIG